MRNCVAWLRCSVIQRLTMADHELFFARVVEVGAGRLKAPPLLYSSRLGWRITGDRAREPGASDPRLGSSPALAAAGFDD